uniref:Uncharacterized protein n=1 Tax=Romanomermis culicivorax TaxID=13658 RepID=A0A915J8G9_ROMCU
IPPDLFFTLSPFNYRASNHTLRALYRYVLFKDDWKSNRQKKLPSDHKKANKFNEFHALYYDMYNQTKVVHTSSDNQQKAIFRKSVRQGLRQPTSDDATFVGFPRSLPTFCRDHTCT